MPSNVSLSCSGNELFDGENCSFCEIKFCNTL